MLARSAGLVPETSSQNAKCGAVRHATDLPAHVNRPAPTQRTAWL